MSDQQSLIKNYVAIIDIGSNAVRLVVYDGLNRAPIRIYSERIICNLGADLAKTGSLNPDSVKKALNSIRRFSGLLQAMEVKNIRAVATAAVRDAKDGKDFIDKVQKEFGLTITIIDGGEEARLSALGVLANGFGGSGLIGDYGGGSLELILVEDGNVTHKASLPLGSHRLMAETGRSARVKMIDTQLESVDFLVKASGLDFYAMGGAWRSMATGHIHMSHHPLKMLDHYEIEGEKALEFAKLISKQNLEALEKTVGLSKKRIRDMNVAALTMERLFERVSPRRLIFSGTGLREGLLFDQLNTATQRQDPLIAGCAKIALKISRFDDLKSFKILSRWIEPLFAGQGDDVLRLMEASCLLSDTGWFEFEDYQAEHAFNRILVLPFYGIDHAGRAFLAISQYIRYRGYLRHDARPRGFDEITGPVQKLLNAKTVRMAVITGLAQRLGYLLTGGALGLLRQTELKIIGGQLVLQLNGRADTLNADVIRDALKGIADKMDLDAVIEK